ncbi:MAG: type II 3-dehydroquinate dehydratase [Clostridiaceae bacterium]
MKILVINGPNLNLLGKREENIYGSKTLAEINASISEYAKNNNAEAYFFQSNIEGEIVSKIGESRKEYDGIIINPAAYSHYSIAILDAIRAISIPVIEVHLSNIYKREDYREKSVTAKGSVGVIAGLGHYGYILALDFLLKGSK